VNVATRGAGNDFHVRAYAFNRLSKLASNGLATCDRHSARVFTRNAVWLFAGGRLIKDKLFFFTAPEWTRVRSQVSSGLRSHATVDQSSRRQPETSLAPTTLAARTTGRIRTASQLGESRVFRLTPPRFMEVAYSVPTDLGWRLSPD